MRRKSSKISKSFQKKQASPKKPAAKSSLTKKTTLNKVTETTKRRRRLTRRTELPVKNPILHQDAARSLFGVTYQEPEIPQSYGMDRLVLLVRDPWWLFAYWEITEQRQQSVLSKIKSESFQNNKTVLRVYDVTGTTKENAHSFFDIELNFYTQSWYIDVGAPNREWLSEIGYRLDDGRFYALVTSNRVFTPAFGISNVLDEEWMMPDEIFYKILGLSVGYSANRVGGSSLDIPLLYEQYMKKAISSFSASSDINRKP